MQLASARKNVDFPHRSKQAFVPGNNERLKEMISCKGRNRETENCLRTICFDHPEWTRCPVGPMLYTEREPDIPLENIEAVCATSDKICNLPEPEQSPGIKG
jgi:hypothetical protein